MSTRKIVTAPHVPVKLKPPSGIRVDVKSPFLEVLREIAHTGVMKKALK